MFPHAFIIINSHNGYGDLTIVFIMFSIEYVRHSNVMFSKYVLCHIMVNNNNNIQHLYSAL